MGLTLKTSATTPLSSITWDGRPRPDQAGGDRLPLRRGRGRPRLASQQALLARAADDGAAADRLRLRPPDPRPAPGHEPLRARLRLRLDDALRRPPRAACGGLRHLARHDRDRA